MAVKPILNKNIVSRPGVNRADHVSTKNLARATNDRQSIKPGLDFSKNFAITLKDIDMSVMTHVKNVMKLRVKEYGEMVEVPVMYANSERWAMARKKGYLRNSKGTVMLPLMLFKRTSTEFNEELPSFIIN